MNDIKGFKQLIHIKLVIFTISIVSSYNILFLVLIFV